MLIINADDYGRSSLATDRIMSCYKQGSVTSTSAMVFMEDSQRAADAAREHGIDVGLHLNFTHRLTQKNQSPLLSDYHDRIARFLTKSKYNFLIYNPALRRPFEYVYQVQFDEFERLYGKTPSHIDGHHHMHLCANMLFGAYISMGRKVRRNFTFAGGEKNFFNRAYRSVIDKWLKRKFMTTDYLFSLPELMKNGRLERVLNLAKTSIVELETHPEHVEEFEWLMGNECQRVFSDIQKGNYAQIDH